MNDEIIYMKTWQNEDETKSVQQSHTGCGIQKGKSKNTVGNVKMIE